MFRNDIVSYSDAIKEAVKDKSVLVIGGAGSIGSSFIKAILPFEPGELCVVDINENALTELTRDLRSSGIYVPCKYLSYPMDYSSETFKRMLQNKQGFDIVANFSAHKHVRSEKDIYSIEALLRNNLINARGLMDLLTEYPPDIYFCVSTDKAANPVNIMGASKRLMEELIFSYSDSFPVKTARFANVAFSNGSLLAGYLNRMEKLQPLSGPSDIRRYFVSPQESGEICMLSAVLGKNREIFFPKLTEAQTERFDSIAIKLLEAYGYRAVECKSEDEAVQLSAELQKGIKAYPVYFSKSNTSGEKLFEEFYTKCETIDNERFSGLGVITNKPKQNREYMFHVVERLNQVFEREDTTKEEIVRIIKDYLPNFNHIETGRSLDEKM